MPHGLEMFLCCGLPVILLFSLPYIGRWIPGSQGVLGAIIPIFCPLMMGLMMFFKGKKPESNTGNTNIKWMEQGEIK